MVGFRGYATFSKSDTIVSAFFFLVSEKRFERADLPARLFRLCGNKTSLGKRMQKFEGTSWAGQGNWSKERWNSWYDHPGNLLLATVKLVLYQQTSETQIHGFKRSYYFKYQKVLEKKLNWIDSTLYYRLLLIRCWESFILQWKEPSAKKRGAGCSHISSKL